MEIFNQMSALDHEQVMFCQDSETGLRAIIAIHNSVLGPALGGLRFWNYASDNDALFDVLRLSRGMSFKAAISGLNLGGGKAVIIGDASKLKNEALLRRFGRFVDNLGGKYITAEDVNIGVKDIEYVMMETEYVTGRPEEMGGSGDPSPVTSFGVYMGMKAAAKFSTGSDSLEGKKVIVQGTGKVGYYLIERLVKEKATVYVFDINQDSVAKACKDFGVTAITESEVFSKDCDIYAPCALGATLNPDTIPQLKCGIVAGGANNQLLDEKRDGVALQQKGILYAPDFMINAGGLMNVHGEIEGYNRARVMAKAEKIYDTTLSVLKTAQEKNITPQEAALTLALNRINKIGNVQKFR